jgi:hypothetical protein
VVPTPDGGNNLIWIGGPDEGLWIVVGLREEAVDSGFESTIDLNTPRLGRRLVKKPSTAFSQLAGVGVK